jgi:hypothetical protein
MTIGLLGDIHGRIKLALTGLLAWQSHMGRPFDLIVQVGDMGAFPTDMSIDSETRSYAALDPTERDFGRMLSATGTDGEHFARIRSMLRSPITSFGVTTKTSAGSQVCPWILWGQRQLIGLDC